MTRDVARRPLFLLFCASLASVGVMASGVVVPGCFTGGGGGTNPPTNTFYFPVGLAVSSGGNALYAVNSDFDLQWNGGTLQSYDLYSIRRHTAELILANEGQGWIFGVPPTGGSCAHGSQSANGRCPDPSIDFLTPWLSDCEAIQPSISETDAGVLKNPEGMRLALGQLCAPPVDSTQYERDSAIIGAFATTLQLQTNLGASGALGARLYAPVRGNATLTWADIGSDGPNEVPCEDRGFVPDGGASFPDGGLSCFKAGVTSPFTLNCGQGHNSGVCDSTHGAGSNPSEPGNTRGATMPGEPFGMAQTPDGTAVAITHQTETETSLLSTGFDIDQAATSIDAGVQLQATACPEVDGGACPSMQFVLDNSSLPNGGSGIAAIPHDPDAPVPPCELVHDQAPCVRPAFLETNHSSAVLALLRYYDDQGTYFDVTPPDVPPAQSPSLRRPYLTLETTLPLTANLGGTDERGIVIDATQRIACKAGAQTAADRTACVLHWPARVFIASRSPPSVIVGQLGVVDSPNFDNQKFNPDEFKAVGNIPLPVGPSQVYLAPIVNPSNELELRVFVVNFDSSTISIINPALPDPAFVDTLYVGPGPFAMAFDPFSLDDVAVKAQDRVKETDPKNPKGLDPRQDPRLNLKPYRFAYVASFTQSFVQVIDLDQSEATYESVVFTLGNPTPPKGQ